ncbi:DNA mismatch repair endonuclease MutL [Ktedonosporobacter rubrisoli]|nr:DNA mismatch repair endonuclease MutL [Ktedonosporobacter rubrisoli]
MPIRQLAPDVAAKIAAGEVVERPASVVKELIENSIDAGASQIRVDLMHGGLQLIRITDNGCGIVAAELPLALERHATSKVERIDDLEHIRSLGFRGEALASIAAVADVTLLSRGRGAEQGAQISASSGQILPVTPAASPEGTTLTVRNLFSAVPARLKFLKSRNTEVSHCHHLLEQYALAYPEIRFSVFSDGRQIFATKGDGALSSVLVEVYGLQVAEQMVPVHSPEQEDAERPVISGYTSRPTCYKSTRQHISFFVNRRWVMSRMLTAAVEGAYHSLLLTGRHPISVINVQIDPTFLDVNVHPAKTEIRFLKERRVFAAILRAVREALLEQPQMPQWQARKETTDEITSEPDKTEDLAGEEELSAAFAESSQTADQEGSQEKASIPSDSPWITFAEEESGTRPPMLSRLWQSHVRGSVTDQESQSTKPTERAEAPLARLQTRQSQESQPKGPLPSPVPESRPQPTQLPEMSGVETRVEPAPAWPLSRGEARGAPIPEQELQISQESLGVGESIDPQQKRRLPRLRVIGQLSQSYIVTEGEDGMYLIDQHAAHERILLERMVASLKARTPLSQLLLTPIQLKLAPGELEAIEEHQAQLEHIGFSLEREADSTIEVRAVPSVLVKQMNARSVHELLVDLTAEENLGHTETWEERALANVACKAAIKANYFLTSSEMREMLEQLEQTRAPYSCCHGRPTMVHFGLSALEREFGRR